MRRLGRSTGGSVTGTAPGEDPAGAGLIGALWPRRGPAGSLAVGLVVGVVYGATLRAWMRLASADPSFTWSGTGYIVGAFAVLGAMAGLTVGLRRRGGRRAVLAARAAGTLLSLGCFVAAGAAMFPTVVPAGLALARSDWPRRLRAALALIGVAAAVAVVLSMTELSWPRRIVTLATYLPLCVVEVALVAQLYSPSLPRRAPGSRTELAVTVARR